MVVLMPTITLAETYSEGLSMAMVTDEKELRLIKLLRGVSSLKKPYLKPIGESWRQRPWQLKDGSELLELWRSEDQWIGLPFDLKTWFCFIDIDNKSDGEPSKYHNPEDVANIRALFEEVGILLYPYRSSSTSEGIHLLAVFDKPVDTLQLARLIHAVLNSNGYEVNKNGTLEVRPQLKKDGTLAETQGRLPFQLGYAPLNEFDLTPTATYNNYQEREEAFLWFASNRYTPSDEIDWSYLDSIHTGASGTTQKDKLSALATKGKEYWNGEGLTAYGQRQYALLCLLVYLSQTLYPAGHEEERFQAAWGWLQKNHNGFSRDWNEQGEEFCRKQLHSLVFDWLTHKESPRARMGRIQKDKAILRLIAGLDYLINTGHESAITKTKGKRLNLNNLYKELRNLNARAKEDETFCIPGLTNTQLLEGFTRDTLYKRGELLEAHWLRGKGLDTP